MKYLRAGNFRHRRHSRGLIYGLEHIAFPRAISSDKRDDCTSIFYGHIPAQPKVLNVNPCQHLWDRVRSGGQP